MPKSNARIIEPPAFQLNNGKSIPSLGLGTWQSAPGEVKVAVEHALRSGYKHIDGAFAYANEAEVGQGIAASGVKREDIFITGKLWCTHHRTVDKAIDLSLKELGIDYFDLFLIHWPVALNANGNDPKFPTKPDGSRDMDEDWTIAQTWQQMEEVLASGKTKAIGVSNFSEVFMESLLKTAKVVPAVNQIELHPYLPQHNLVKYLKSKGIVPEAYSPLGSTSSPLLKDPKITALADKYGVGAGTILISYPIARGIVVLPKSVTPSRIEENRIVVDLSQEDMDILDNLHKETTKRFVKPAWPIDLKFDDW